MSELLNPRMKLAVASTNPVKIQAAEQALVNSFPTFSWHISSCAVASNVAEQPLSATETRQGALNRLANLQVVQPDAHCYVAFEGGYDRLEGMACTFAYIALHYQGQTVVGRTAVLPLPERIATQLERGAELGPLMDAVFNLHNIKQQGGAIGILTDGLLTRADVYRDTLLLLLAPFRYPTLYGSSQSQT